MKIEVTCKAYIDIDIHKPDFWNSDTINEYKEDLLSEISNTAMDKIWENPIKNIAEELQNVKNLLFNFMYSEYELNSYLCDTLSNESDMNLTLK
jgi:hypothetical protein